MKTKDKWITVELVCTGNEERSKYADAFAQQYIQQQRLANNIQVSSSGTHVDKIRKVMEGENHDRELEFTIKKTIIEKALRIGLLPEHEGIAVLAEVGSSTTIEDGALLLRVNKLYRYARFQFPFIRDQLLEPALKEYGIPLQNGEPRQYTPHTNAAIVLAMGAQNKKAIEEMRVDGQKPFITTFHQFSSRENPIVPIIMEKDPAKYAAFLAYLHEATPEMVRKAIEYGN